MDIDVNKPVENPVLKNMLDALQNAPDDVRPALCEKIAEELAQRATLLVVMTLENENIETHPDGTAEFKEGTTMSFAMLTTTDGTPYLPVFTDWVELKKAGQYQNDDVKTLIAGFDDMAAICRGEAGIAVNPFSHNFVISPKDVVHIKQHKDEVNNGFAEHTVQKTTQVQVGEPADYPTEMVEAIKKYAETEKAINAIWLKLLIREGEQSYLLIVDFKGDHKPIFKGISSAAGPNIHNGMPIDMVPYSERFGQSAAEGEPFYRRKKGLFFGRK